MDQENTQIDLIISGLKDLHSKFNQNSNHFDDEKDQCLQSLKELFLVRIKENKEKRLRQNMKSVKAIRDVSRTIWVSYIMSYLNLDECFQLGQVCIYFNQIIKSPMFIKFYVTLNERTKIDVSANHFDIAKHQNLPNFQRQPSAPVTDSIKQTRKQKSTQKEDKDAKIEILSNMKLFLLEKVKQSEEKLTTNMKDISILKDMLRIEKNMNQKKEQIIKQKNQEFKETRENALEQQSEWLIKRNEISLKSEEYEKQIENYQFEVKKLKVHKKVLKEEVVNLRQQLSDKEIQAHNKTVALKNLNEFFQKQTTDLLSDSKSVSSSKRSFASADEDGYMGNRSKSVTDYQQIQS